MYATKPVQLCVACQGKKLVRIIDTNTDLIIIPSDPPADAAEANRMRITICETCKGSGIADKNFDVRSICLRMDDPEPEQPMVYLERCNPVGVSTKSVTIEIATSLNVFSVLGVSARGLRELAAFCLEYAQRIEDYPE